MKTGRGRKWEEPETFMFSSFDIRGDGSGFSLHAEGRPPAPDPAAEAVQVQVNDRSGVERDKLGEQETADDGDAQRAAQLGAGALLQRQR